MAKITIFTKYLMRFCFMRTQKIHLKKKNYITRTLFQNIQKQVDEINF